MINFINTSLLDQVVNHKPYVIPNMARLSYLFNNVLSQIKTYYYTSGRYVNRPNKLVTLLNMLDIDFSDTPENIFTYLEASSSYAANTIGFITTTNRNEKPITSTAFYKSDINEYYLVSNEMTLLTNNINILNNGIRVLYHTIDDLFLTHPYEYEFGSSLDYIIFSVDITKIGLGYYYWVRQQKLLDNDIDPARYVYTVLLTNLITDIFAWSVVNRFIRLWRFGEIPKFINLNPFDIPDYSKKLDNVLKKSIKYLKTNKHRYWLEVINNIPILIFNNTGGMLRLPYILTNRRNEWSLWMSRLPIINFLLKNFDKRLNDYLIKHLEKDFKEKDRRKYFDIEDNITSLLLNNEITTLKKFLN